jgi:hypothetical protein
MNRAVVVLLLLIANAVVSTRNLQPLASAASSQDRSRAHSVVIGEGRVASSRAPAGKTPDCRTAEDARAASWLRL